MASRMKEGSNHEVPPVSTIISSKQRGVASADADLAHPNKELEGYHLADASDMSLEQIERHFEFSGESHGSEPLDSLTAHRPTNTDIGTVRPCSSTAAASAQVELSAVETEKESQAVEPEAIWEPREHDVISGRGAMVNAHRGNRNFRALCFARKVLFEHANHAAKKRICAEIWSECVRKYGSRYLKKEDSKGPWYAQPAIVAELKAAQVMRDYQRPDRLLQRGLVGKKRHSVYATPLNHVPMDPMPVQPLIECPNGVHPHDVLSGRGASVNGHPGNQRLRVLSAERKNVFDKATFVNKRVLAEEIVGKIYKLNPPGRFLSNDNPDKSWMEMTKDRAVQKACQVMRDMDRADRRNREEHRRLRKVQRESKMADLAAAVSAKMVEPMSVDVAPMRPNAVPICESAPSTATRP